jgi:mycofactocin precursor
MADPSIETHLSSAEIEVEAEFVLAAGQEPTVDVELLIEDVSIDGMCGVY